MEIMLRPSYLDALAKLGTAEQERIKNFLSKLQRNPTTLGLHVEPIDNGFVSIRANQRIRVVAQQQGETLLLHYIGDHDPAYEWAKKRRLLASLEDGSYRLDFGGGVGVATPVDEAPLAPHEAVPYGEQVVKKLAGTDLPAYIVRSLETCRNEDELYERLETLPQHFQYAALAAVQNLPYEPAIVKGADEQGSVVSPLQSADVPFLAAERQEKVERVIPATQMEIIPDNASYLSVPQEPAHFEVKVPPTTVTNGAVVTPSEVFDPTKATYMAASKQRTQSEMSSGPAVAVTYEATRLLFRAKQIEPLEPSQSFRIITPFGVFEMTKAEFHRAFPNVVASASYRENGIYHYASLPRKALAYRVGDGTNL